MGCGAMRIRCQLFQVIAGEIPHTSLDPFLSQVERGSEHGQMMRVPAVACIAERRGWVFFSNS